MGAQELRQIHAIAGTEQYRRHLRAVFDHLPEAQRGQFLYGPQAVANRLPARDVIMVAGSQDIPRARGHDVCYVEHGAGQSYNGDARSAGSRGYSGAVHPANVRWYISPRQDHAQAWGRTAFAAGCPALDRHAGSEPTGISERLTAVITFHWDASRLCPEAGSAIGDFLPHMAAIVTHLDWHGFDVVGHWHPRTPTMRKAWRELGIPSIPDVDDALSVGHLWLVDNSSVLFEAAALDRPVLALNSLSYRRDVDHGLRFWGAIPGWEIDSVDDLLALDVGAYWREDWSAEARRRAVEYCYTRPPGGAGAAAAAWLSAQVADH